MNFFDWFQLAALGIFAGLATWRAARLGRRLHLNAVTPGRASRLMRVVLVFTWAWTLLVLWYVLPIGQKPLFGWLDRPLFGWLPLRLAGVLFVTLGLALNLLAHLALGDSWRLGIDERHPGPLVTTGVYARSRNPIYLFFNLYLLGTFLIQGRPVLLLFWLLVARLQHACARQEERFLERAFGDDYRRYRGRVRCYWGRTSAAG